MDYMVICGKTGDIKYYTEHEPNLPSVWELPVGSEEDYWTYTKLPEDR